MIKSLHIGRYVGRPGEFRALTEFLEAVGFERLPGSDEASAAFSAPQGMISINKPAHNHPRQVAKRLKDVEKLLVLEVTNPDDILAVARKLKIKVLAESEPLGTPERTFWLELPGAIVVAVHGQPEEPEPALEGRLNAAGKSFAVVVSRFNSFITERLLQGALDGLLRCGAEREDVDVVRVPGSFEVPLAARTLAETRKYDAILCIGCLLRGDTAHYDVIVNEVTRGIGQSAQETGVPHAFGILTCDTLDQAIDRAGLKMGNKGFEAALAAVEMANLKKAVVGRSPLAVGQNKGGARRSRSGKTKPR